MDIEGLIRDGAHREAAAALARHYGVPLGRLCMALLASQAEAEEVVQETLLAAYRGMAGFRADGSAKAWVFAIARRHCARRLEKRTRRAAKLALVSNPPDPAGELGARERARQIRAALDQLKPSEREAVVLRYLAQLDYPEIAEVLAVKPDAARKRVSRGLSALRDLFSGEDDR